LFSKRIKPAGEASFTTHHLSPEALLYLTQVLYERNPEVWLLGIRGYRFSLGEKLSPKAGKISIKPISVLLSF